MPPPSTHTVLNTPLPYFSYHKPSFHFTLYTSTSMVLFPPHYIHTAFACSLLPLSGPRRALRTHLPRAAHWFIAVNRWCRSSGTRGLRAPRRGDHTPSRVHQCYHTSVRLAGHQYPSFAPCHWRITVAAIPCKSGLTSGTIADIILYACR